MNLDLEGRRAIVTGGSRGIGKAVAIALAREGVSVAIVARNQEPLDVTAAEIGDLTGVKVVAIAGDASDDASVKQVVERAAEELGTVDILVNSAARPGGGGSRQPGATLDFSAIADDTNVKVLGYLRFAQAAAPLMMEQSWGRIVNVGGAAVRQTGQVITSMRNAAVVAMGKNLADQLGQHGITVNTVHPSFTRTEREVPPFAPVNTIGRFPDAAEVAALITFLVSPLAGAITGESIACGGGILGGINY